MIRVSNLILLLVMLGSCSEEEPLMVSSDEVEFNLEYVQGDWKVFSNDFDFQINYMLNQDFSYDINSTDPNSSSNISTFTYPQQGGGTYEFDIDSKRVKFSTDPAFSITTYYWQAIEYSEKYLELAVYDFDNECILEMFLEKVD